MSLTKGIRNYKSKILLVFMLFSGFLMIKNQMDQTKRERKQYFFNYSGELTGNMTFVDGIYYLDTGFITYEFKSSNCTEHLREFAEGDKIVKKSKTTHFSLLKLNGVQINCQ